MTASRRSAWCSHPREARYRAALDAAGIDRIEAGFPRVSADDFEAVKAIAAAGLKAEVWASRAPCRPTSTSRRARRSALRDREPDLGRQARRPRRLARDDLERIRSAVAFATEHGIRVAFFGVDSSRADLEFFDRAYEAAVEQAPPRRSSSTRSGSPLRRPRRSSFRARSTASTCRCTGTATTTSGSGRPRRSRRSRPGRPGCRARSTGWASGRGTPISSRSRLRSRRCTDPDPPRSDPGEEPSRLMQKGRTPLPPWKAVTGEALFTRESGAVAAQFHDPPAIEPYASELVGAERGIVLGRERDRLDPDRGRTARPRRAARQLPGAPRRGEGARDEAAVARGRTHSSAGSPTRHQEAQMARELPTRGAASGTGLQSRRDRGRHARRPPRRAARAEPRLLARRRRSPWATVQAMQNVEVALRAAGAGWATSCGARSTPSTRPLTR